MSADIDFFIVTANAVPTDRGLLPKGSKITKGSDLFNRILEDGNFNSPEKSVSSPFVAVFKTEDKDHKQDSEVIPDSNADADSDSNADEAHETDEAHENEDASGDDMTEDDDESRPKRRKRRG